MGKSAASIFPQPIGLLVAAMLSIVMWTASGELLLTIKSLAKLTTDLQLEAPTLDFVYCRQVKRDYFGARTTADSYKRFLAGFSLKFDDIDSNVLRLTALKSSRSFSNDSSLSLTI